MKWFFLKVLLRRYRIQWNVLKDFIGLLYEMGLGMLPIYISLCVYTLFLGLYLANVIEPWSGQIYYMGMTRGEEARVCVECCMPTSCLHT